MSFRECTGDFSRRIILLKFSTQAALTAHQLHSSDRYYTDYYSRNILTFDMYRYPKSIFRIVYLDKGYIKGVYVH